MNKDEHYNKTQIFYKQKATLTEGYYDSEPGQLLRHSLWTHLTRKNIISLLSNIIKKEPHVNSIVDVGCGRGDFTKKIGEKFPSIKRVDGVDNIDEALKIAERETKHLKHVNFKRVIY